LFFSSPPFCRFNPFFFELPPRTVSSTDDEHYSFTLLDCFSMCPCIPLNPNPFSRLFGAPSSSSRDPLLARCPQSAFFETHYGFLISRAILALILPLHLPAKIHKRMFFLWTGLSYPARNPSLFFGRSSCSVIIVHRACFFGHMLFPPYVEVNRIRSRRKFNLPLFLSSWILSSSWRPFGTFFVPVSCLLPLNVLF